MHDQREAIARAALNVLLEKGVYEASLRDICKAAKISIGAFYVHFKTKEDLISAACLLDQVDRRPDLAADWESYLSEIKGAVRNIASAPGARRFRISLQFVAEVAQMDHNPEGLSMIYSMTRDRFESVLKGICERGEISLPFGVEKTAELHLQLMTGACYRIAGDRDLDVDQVLETLCDGMSMTAGLVHDRTREEPAASVNHSPAESYSH